MRNTPRPLPSGYVLYQYRIERKIGSGGFSITYLAYDGDQDKYVAIKEYLPENYAIRHSEATVRMIGPEAQEVFDWGMERFLEEAQTLAQFEEHPNLVGVQGFFNENGTAYIVMDYIPGELLSTYIERETPLSEGALHSILQPVIAGLSEVHAKGYLHRDIKPENIMLRPDGSPVLLDFGAARFAIGAKTQNLTSVLTQGYAPIEQYSQTAPQGPYTDIYALGAVAYKGLTGEMPQPATDRMIKDKMPVLAEQGYEGITQDFLEGIDVALQLYPKARPISLTSWLRKLGWESQQDASDKSESDKIHERRRGPLEVQAEPEDGEGKAATDDNIAVGGGKTPDSGKADRAGGVGKTILALVLVIVIVILLWLLLR